MAALDPRLLDLIETLVTARMDWLVFEIMDGIRAGKRPRETAESLAEARRIIRAGESWSMDGTAQPTGVRSEPIVGDDQIAWAAHHVAERLDTVTAMMAAALDALDDIGTTGDAEQVSTTGAPVSPPLTISLDDGLQHRVDRDGIGVARDALVGLRGALTDWTDRTSRPVRA